MYNLQTNSTDESVAVSHEPQLPTENTELEANFSQAETPRQTPSSSRTIYYEMLEENNQLLSRIMEEENVRPKTQEEVLQYLIEKMRRKLERTSGSNRRPNPRPMYHQPAPQNPNTRER